MSGFLRWLQDNADTSANRVYGNMPGGMPDVIAKGISVPLSLPEMAGRTVGVPIAQVWLKAMELDAKASRQLGGRYHYHTQRLRGAGPELFGKNLGEAAYIPLSGITPFGAASNVALDSAKARNAGQPFWWGRANPEQMKRIQAEANRIYEEEGPEAYYAFLTKGRGVEAFAGEMATSPLNLLPVGGAIGKGAQGTSRAAIAARGLGRGAMATDRALGLPFELAFKGIGATGRQAGRIPAIGRAVNHMRSLAPDSQAAMEVRRMWNWLREATGSGASLDDVLGTTQQGPAVPTGPAATQIPLTPAGGQAQPQGSPAGQGGAGVQPQPPAGGNAGGMGPLVGPVQPPGGSQNLEPLVGPIQPPGSGVQIPNGHLAPTPKTTLELNYEDRQVQRMFNIPLEELNSVETYARAMRVYRAVVNGELGDPNDFKQLDSLRAFLETRRQAYEASRSVGQPGAAGGAADDFIGPRAPAANAADDTARRALIDQGLSPEEVDELMASGEYAPATPDASVDEADIPFADYEIRNGRVYRGGHDVTHVGRVIARSDNHREVRDAVVEHVEETGDVSIVLAWWRQTGQEDKNLMSTINNLFGNVLPDKPGYAGTYNDAVRDNPAVARETAIRVLQAQTPERLRDLLTFIQVSVAHRGGKLSNQPLGWVSELTSHPRPDRAVERVKGAIQTKYKGKTTTPKQVYDPENPDVDSLPGMPQGDPLYQKGREGHAGVYDPINPIGTLREWVGERSAPPTLGVGVRTRQLDYALDGGARFGSPDHEYADEGIALGTNEVVDFLDEVARRRNPDNPERFYDRLFIHGASGEEYATNQQTGMLFRVRGSFNFGRNGEHLIGLFGSADASTLVHEVGHFIRATLSEEEFYRASQIYNNGERVWSVAAEEAFAEDFLTYVSSGYIRNRSDVLPIFARMRETLVELWRRVRGDKRFTSSREYWDELLSPHRHSGESGATFGPATPTTPAMPREVFLEGAPGVYRVFRSTASARMEPGRYGGLYFAREYLYADEMKALGEGRSVWLFEIDIKKPWVPKSEDEMMEMLREAGRAGLVSPDDASRFRERTLYDVPEGLDKYLRSQGYDSIIWDRAIPSGRHRGGQPDKDTLILLDMERGEVLHKEFSEEVQRRGSEADTLYQTASPKSQKAQQQSLFGALKGASPLSNPDALNNLSDEAVQGLQKYKDTLLSARDRYTSAHKELLRLVGIVQSSTPGFDPSRFKNHQDLIKGMKEVVRNPNFSKQLDDLAKPWDAIGADLLSGNVEYAMGATASIEIARSLAPNLFKHKGSYHKFLMQTLPTMWKEQALMSGRFLEGNVADIIFKSLLHGMKPFDSSPTLQNHADSLGVPVPEETVHTAKEALVAAREDRVMVASGEKMHTSRLRGKAGRVGDAIADIREDNFGTSAFRRIPGGKAFNPIAATSEFVLGLNSLIEASGRGAMWRAGSTNHMQQFGKGVVDDLGRLGRVAPQVLEGVERALAAENYVVPAQRAYDIAIANGVDNATARKFQRAWANLTKQASNKGVELSNHIHFDYSARTNLDMWVQKVMPFHFWASRNIPFYLEHMAEHPLLAVTWARWNRISNEANEDEPGRMRDMMAIFPGGVVQALFGQGGMVGMNPMHAMSVTSQIDPGQGTYTEDMPALGRGLQEVAAKTGFMPGPISELGLNVAGAYGTRPRDPGWFRHAGVVEGLTGLNPNEPIRMVADAVRGIRPGMNPESHTGSGYRDYLIQRRIGELSQEREGVENHPDYLQAMSDPSSAIWKDAEADVVRMLSMNNFLSLVTPFQTRFAGQTERDVAGARDALGPDYQRGDPDADPDLVSLRNTYSAVGNSAEETELRAALEMLSQASWDQGGYRATLARREQDRIIKQNPILGEFFAWLNTPEGRSVPEGEKLKAFMNSR